MCGDVLCGIRPESLVSPEQVAPFFVTGTIFFRQAMLSLSCVSGDTRGKQSWTALADEAQRAIGAASRDREGPRGGASGMGGSKGKGAGGAQ